MGRQHVTIHTFHECSIFFRLTAKLTVVMMCASKPLDVFK